MKKSNLSIIILFFVILSIPLFTFNVKPDQISEIDNRKLAELPIYGKVEDYTKSIESYLNDRIGLRIQMIDGYTQLNDKLFNVMIHPSYSYGKNGYVFGKFYPEHKDYEYVETFANFIQKAQKYCKERGSTFLYCLNPSKTTVYDQYLPMGVNLKNERINLLLEFLESNGSNFLYTAPLLKEASEPQQVFNVKYDAGHWNDDGAFLAINKIIEKLQETNPTIKSLNITDYNIEEVVYNSLPVSRFPIHEDVRKYSLKNGQKAEKISTYDNEIKVDANYSAYGHFKNSYNQGAPKILIFRGSYFGDKEKFLVDSFSETILVHNYVNVTDLDYYFNLFQPDIVLFESAEYATTAYYFSQDLLQKANYNPSYKNFEDLPIAVDNPINIEPLVENERGNMISDIRKFTYQLEGEEVAYAYARVGGKVYDFKIYGSPPEQTLEIYLTAEQVNAEYSMEVILIPKNEKEQSILNSVIHHGRPSVD